MIALHFILLVTALGVVISCRLSPEVTWFTYYIGGVVGLFGSGIMLEAWNRKRRREEIEASRGK
ncbi:MAG: hypothetical protein JW821_16210 [Deltaproteobacteria bacterium]|nr:hypothetical protein [Deltaproteobacteria bacterium]